MAKAFATQSETEEFIKQVVDARNIDPRINNRVLGRWLNRSDTYISKIITGKSLIGESEYAVWHDEIYPDLVQRINNYARFDDHSLAAFIRSKLEIAELLITKKLNIPSNRLKKRLNSESRLFLLNCYDAILGTTPYLTAYSKAPDPHTKNIVDLVLIERNRLSNLNIPLLGISYLVFDDDQLLYRIQGKTRSRLQIKMRRKLARGHKMLQWIADYAEELNKKYPDQITDKDLRNETKKTDSEIQKTLLNKYGRNSRFLMKDGKFNHSLPRAKALEIMILMHFEDKRRWLKA